MFVLLILVELITITVKTLSFQNPRFLEIIKTESESRNVNIYDDFNKDIRINYQRSQQKY